MLKPSEQVWMYDIQLLYVVMPSMCGKKVFVELDLAPALIHVSFCFFSTDAAEIEDGGTKTFSAPLYSLNPSFDLAKNGTGSPQGGFILRHCRVF
jgi:hypothetical protein